MRTASGHRACLWVVGAGAGLLVPGAFVAVAPAASAASSSLPAVSTPAFAPGIATFSYTGSIQDWTIPAGTAQLTVTTDGASGGSGGDGFLNSGGSGAAGDSIENTFPVSANSNFAPGDTLAIFVGGQGGNGQLSAFPGGGGGNLACSGATVFCGGNGGQGGGGSGVADIDSLQWINIAAGGGGGGGGSSGLADNGNNASAGIQYGGDNCTPPDPLNPNGSGTGHAGDDALSGSGSGGGGGGGGGCPGGAAGASGSDVDSNIPTAGNGGSPGDYWAGSVGLTSFGTAPSGDGTVTIKYFGPTPTLTTTPNATSVALGSAPVTLKDTATLSGGSNPTGTITFSLYYNGGTTPVDTEPVTVSGNGSYTSPTGYTPSPGTYQWDADYSGDVSNEAVRDDNDPGEVVTVSSASPTLTTTPNATSVALGSAPVTLKDTATLSGGSNPTGTITFSLYYNGGTTPVDTEPVTVSGNGSYKTPGYAVPSSGTVTGSYQWNVSYSGDSNNAPASDNNDPGELVTVSAATPALTTTPSSTSVTYDGTSPTLTDTATLSGGFNPTGQITFTLIYYQAHTSIFELTLPDTVDTETYPVTGNGVYSTPTGYTLPTSGPVAGYYQWNAAYSGDTNNNSASDTNDAAEATAVNPELAVPTTTLNASSPTVTYGSETGETLSGTVSGPSGDGTPQGSVMITSGGMTLCQAGLNPGAPDTAAYSCTLSATELPAGDANVQATYVPGEFPSSNPNFTYAGSGATASLTVNQAVVQPATTLNVSSPTVAYGSETAETLTGSVSGPSGDGTPEGFVVITSGTTTLCVAPLAPGASDSAPYICQLTATQLNAGNYPNVQAVYQPAGTSSSNPSVGYTESNVAAASLTVSPEVVSSTTTLNVSSPAVTYGSETAETLSGTVSGPSGDGAPLGSVGITSGATTICVAPLTAGAPDSATYSCTLTAAQLHAGNYGNVRATYLPAATSSANPDYTYNASSGSGSFTVNQATPVISWPNPANVVFGTLLSSTQLDATASVLGTFAYSPAAGTLLPPGNGQAPQVTFTPADSTDYTNATGTVNINVTSLACVTGTSSGSLTVGSGQAGCVKTGGTVAGSATVGAGGALYMNGGTIKGSLTVTRATAVYLCNVTIKGTLSISGSTGPVIVGGTGCTNTIQGSVSITGNTGGVTYLHNSATDSLTITGNSGPFNYIASDNTTSGKVTVSNNT